MMFQNILVPFDLTNQSTKAVKVAFDIAKTRKSQVVLLTCLEGDAWHHKYYDGDADSVLIKQQKKVTKKYLEKLEPTAEKYGVTLKSKIIPSKNVVKDIVTFAKTGKFDLVVIGSHGRSGFDKWLLGSVANGVSQKVHCPVMIVK